MPPAPASPDLTQWWLGPQNQNQPLGPLEVPAVLALVRQGRVTAADLACPVGGMEWKPLQAWPTFASSLAAPPAATTPPASGRIAARRRPGTRQYGKRSGNGTLAFKLLLLGISFGLIIGGSSFAWWWLGGSGDLPREASYLSEDTAFVLTVRLSEARRSPLAAQCVKNCLASATQCKFTAATWEKDFEYSLGVPPGYVEMLLFSAGKTGDWLLILRLDRPLNTQDVENNRQAGTTRKDLKFEADNAYKQVVFTEFRSGPSAAGTAAGPCFCMPHPQLLLLAPRKQLLGDALARSRWPLLAPSFRSTIAQANFSRDLALALNLKTEASPPWKDLLGKDLVPLQLPDALTDAEGLALDYQRDGKLLRATFHCPSPSRAEELRGKGQTWLEQQAKEAGERKEMEDLRPLYQNLTLTAQERRVTLQGPIAALEARWQPKEEGDKPGAMPTAK